MPEVLTPDLCVIGAGSGGLSVAAAAAMFGVPVVLIERGRMGGDCLNVGCVPSKAILAAAHRAHDIRTAAALGLQAGEPDVVFGRVHRHVQGVIAAIAPNDSAQRFASLGVRVISGEAAFADARTVHVGEIAIKARRFVVATGSTPFVPPIEGIDAVPILTNETIFDQTERPQHLLVLGGGPIGVELGQAFRRLGSEVTIIEAERLLPHEDAEIAAFAARSLRADGVALREGARAVRIEGEAGALRIALDGADVVAGTHLLVAAGRRPNIDALNLAAAGIAHGPAGITVDARLKTSNSRVYAIGDCATGATGGLQFTHAANHHAGIVIRSALFRLPARVGRQAIPRVTYCDPEIASVGLTEDGARAAGKPFQVLRWPFAENDRAQAERTAEGLIKIVTDPKGRILGASLAGPKAGDLLMPWIIAVEKKWSVQEMAGFIFPYPTLSEVSKRVALTHFSPMAQKPWIRRIIAVLRMLG